MKQGNKTKLRILTVANKLFYHKGFNSTSIGDIVKETGLSKGNITYHFKNKQNILEAIVDMRMKSIQKMFNLWNEKTDTPQERLYLFCDMILKEQDNLLAYGCPMGTLTGELSKDQPSLYQIAIPMFQYFRQWLSQQFLLLKVTPAQADQKALSLLSRAQGIAVITHIFKDKDFLTKEVENLKTFIRKQFNENHNS